MRLMNKIIVVTGAGAGIGRAISLRLAKEGAFVFATDANLRGAEETLGLIKKDNNLGFALSLDVLRLDTIKEAIDTVLEKKNVIDVWVNNAGVSSMGHVWDMTESDWDINMDINAKGTFLCTIEVLNRSFIKQKHGKFINLASIAAMRSDPLLSAYCASKWAVRGFTRTVAKECGPFGVTANMICPGPVDTMMTTRENSWAADIMHITPNQARQIQIDAIPLGRLVHPEDIASTAAFLASSDSDFINGAEIQVTGGMDV